MKKDQMCVYQKQELEEGATGSRQSKRHKLPVIHKYYVYNVQCDKCIIHTAVIYESSEEEIVSSLQEKGIFLLLSFFIYVR